MDQDKNDAPTGREALKELLDAALARWDAGFIVPRVIPSWIVFTPMIVHIGAIGD